jgi:hypothetical protein
MNRPIRTEASYNRGIVAISQNSNTTPSLSAAADLTPWLCELNAQLDGALADLAHTMHSVHRGTYARDANGQSFRLVQANFVPDATHLATRALERAAVTCFRSAIASFISFLDRLIAFQDLVVCPTNNLTTQIEYAILGYALCGPCFDVERH